MLLTAVAVVRVVATYDVFNSTSDEPAHISTGMEWLERRTYTYEVEHPPLARIAVALGPFLKGLRLPKPPRPPEFDNGAFIFDEGNQVLYADGQYWQNLTLARIGVLPFLILLCAVTYFWSARYFDYKVGAGAVFLLVCSPPVLGQAGIATLDAACAATTCAALYCFVLWLEEPADGNTVLLGFATAVAVLTKFSSIAFLGACYLAALVAFAYTGKIVLSRRIGSAAIAVLVAFVVLWAGYRFTLAPLSATYGASPRIDELLSRAPFLQSAWHTLLNIPIPLTEMLLGIRDLWRHNMIGHDSYLLGEYRNTGWWYFFPVVLAVKTPLGLLVLALAGSVLVLRRAVAVQWLTALFPLIILCVSMTSRIDAGVRHILPIYPLLAILGGYAIAEAVTKNRALAATAMLLAAWVAVDSWRAHPDYMAHFNELAGSHPERILTESDLDLGQDVHRLSQRLKELGADHVSVALAGSAPLALAGLPPYRVMGRDEPAPGYIAVSLRYLNLGYAKNGAYAWLKPYQPIERIGRSIDLYRVDQLP